MGKQRLSRRLGYNKAMTATILDTLRAITAVTLRRILTPVIWIAGIVLFVLYGGVILLVTQISGWWALLLLIVIPLTLLILVIGGGLWFASGKLLPNRYKGEHKKDIIAFTDKILRLVENSKTPYPVHLLLIGKDVIRGRESSHLRELIDDSKTLKRDFEELRKKF